MKTIEKPVSITWKQVRNQVRVKLGGNSTKYSMITERRMPPNTRPLPRPMLTSVNQSIAPARTTMNPEICPIKIKKSQISARYVPIIWAKLTSGD